MGRITSLVLGIILIPCVLFAASLKFDPVDRADGYKVYYTDGTEEKSLRIGKQTMISVEVFDLVPGTEYTFSVTAYNNAGESPRSNSVTFTHPVLLPSAPTGLMITGIDAN